MAELIGVVGVMSSVLTIATVTLQLSKSSSRPIAGFGSQRKDLADIQDDLSALAVVLELICAQDNGSPCDTRLDPLLGPPLCC